MAALESNIISMGASTIQSTITTVTTAPITEPKSKKLRRPPSVKAEKQKAHFRLVLEAAWVVSRIFKQHGIACAVFGSLAAKLYGAPRSPKDVDLLTLQQIDDASTQLSQQDLKDLILRTDSEHFYLKMPRDPAATYRILWYRQRYNGPECKVDILTPGAMDLPSLRLAHILFIDSIPVVPFGLLLLHKLQGWEDHRKAEDAYHRRKQHQDAGDVRRLMDLKQEMRILKTKRPWHDVEVFGVDFMTLSRERVIAYCEAFPDRADDWKDLGFCL